MATIERSYTLEQGPTRSIFNPSAIPSAPPFALPLHASTSEATATNGLDTDLIDLGQERLFSGTRTRATRQDQDQDETTVGSSGDREDAAPRGTIQQQQQKVRPTIFRPFPTTTRLNPLDVSTFRTN